MTPPPPTSTLFPYTTLFRSLGADQTRRPLLDRDRPLGVRPQRQAGHAQDGGFLLNAARVGHYHRRIAEDRKSTRLNSSHPSISYAVFCLKKKKTGQTLPL